MPESVETWAVRGTPVAHIAYASKSTRLWPLPVTRRECCQIRQSAPLNAADTLPRAAARWSPASASLPTGGGGQMYPPATDQWRTTQTERDRRRNYRPAENEPTNPLYNWNGLCL